MTMLHNLTPLRGTIKELASEARDLRKQARDTFGDARWTLKHEANGLAPDARYNQLAYGYLRGFSISQMESPFTRNAASATLILATAKPYFHKRVVAQPLLIEETEAERKAAWLEFTKHIEADVRAWNSACYLRVLERDAALVIKKEVA